MKERTVMFAVDGDCLLMGDEAVEHLKKLYPLNYGDKIVRGTLPDGRTVWAANEATIEAIKQEMKGKKWPGHDLLHRPTPMEKPIIMPMEKLPLPTWQSAFGRDPETTMGYLQKIFTDPPPTREQLMNGPNTTMRMGYTRPKGGADHAAGDDGAQPDPPLSAGDKGK